VPPELNRPLYAASKAILQVLSKLLFRLQHEGVENIPREGPLLIASNHQSHLDPPMIGLGIPRYVYFIAKRELARSRLLGWYMRNLGTILVDRGQGREALEAALEYLNAGRAVVIFPEGTRTRTGRLNPGRKGVGVLAHRSGAVVLPTCITGANRCFPVGSKIIRPGRIKVRFGKPLRFTHLPSGPIAEELVEQTTAKIMQAIEELVPPELRPLPEERARWHHEGGHAA